MSRSSPHSSDLQHCSVVVSGKVKPAMGPRPSTQRKQTRSPKVRQDTPQRQQPCGPQWLRQIGSSQGGQGGETRGTKPEGSRAVAGEHHDMRSSPTAGLSVAWRGPAASVGQRQRQMGHHKASVRGETSGTKPKEVRAKAGEHHDVRSSPMAVLSISWKGPVASCWARTAALPQSTAES